MPTLKTIVSVVLLAATLFLLVAFSAHAQVVPAQNQVIPSAYFGQGYVISTSTSPTHKLGASLVDLAGSFITGILGVSHGGTGSTTLTGILNGNGTSAVGTLLIGSGLSYDGTTLSATASGGGSGNVATSSAETSGRIPFWTSTAATPATLSGGVAGFNWDNTNVRLGIGTSTPGSTLAVGGLVIANNFTGTSTTATSTFYGGISVGANPFNASGANFLVDSGGRSAFGPNNFGTDISANLKTTGNIWITNSAKIVLGSQPTSALAGNIYQTISGEANGNNLTFTTYQDHVWQTLTNGTTGAGTEHMRLTQAGNLGIGTSTPSSKLNVYGSDAGTTLTAASVAMADITNSNTTNNNFSDLAFSQVNASGASVVDSKIAGVHTAHTAAAESGDLAFLTRSAGTLAEKMRILANGNVGIGTSSPTGILTIDNGTITTDVPLLTGVQTWNNSGTTFNGMRISVINTASNAASNLINASIANTSTAFKIQYQSTTGTKLILGSNGGDAVISANGNLLGIGTGANHDVQFNNVYSQRTGAGNRVGIGTTTPWGLLSVNPDATLAGRPIFVVGSSTATHFIVDNTGNVGVGTTTPAYKLNVSGTQGVIGIESLTANQVGDLRFLSNTTGNDTKLGKLSFANTSSISSTIAEFAAYQGASTGYSYFTFSTKDAASALTERMRLSSIGNLGIGTTSPFANLSIHANNGATNTTLFAIGSSTASATTTLFKVDNTGSTTAANGFNISSGCYAINGTCITSGGPSGSGAAGQATFWSGTSAITGDNSFWWDNTNKFLGLGTSSPAFNLELSNVLSGTTNTQFRITNTGSTGFSQLSFDSGTGTNLPFRIQNNNSGTANTNLTNIPLTGLIQTGSANTGGMVFVTQAAAPIIFGTGGTATGNERLRITSTGLVGIGTTTPGTLFSVGSIANFATATSTFYSGLNVASLQVGSLSGILKAVGGYVTTALVNLATDVTGILAQVNGGTGTTTPDMVWEGTTGIPRTNTYPEAAIASASSGYNTLYTVPAGKRAFIVGINLVNRSGSSANVGGYILTGASYQQISSTPSVTSPGNTTSILTTPLFLDAGQAIVASTSAAGVSFTPQIIEFPNTIPSFTATTTLSGDNTYNPIFTASGYTYTTGALRYNTNQNVTCVNGNNASVNAASYLKTSGGSLVPIGATTSVAAFGASSLGTVNVNLNSGDSVGVISATAANMFCFANLIREQQ